MEGVANIKTGKQAVGEEGIMTSAGENNPVLITRRLNIKIQGSMSDFAQDGQGCATWRAVDGKQASIWGLKDSQIGLSTSGTLASTHESDTHKLGNAVIHRAVLLESKNGFGVSLGVTINCLPSNEVTGYGEEYCYTVLPDSNNTVPIKLFELSDDNEDGHRWRKEYPKYNASNLHKQGVLDTSDCSYVFVHDHHPAIALLRANKDLLGSDIDNQQKIDNEWYKVQKETFSTCCNTLLHKVLPSVNRNDLNNFSVELHRIGTRDWLDLLDGDDALASFVPPIGATVDQISDLETKHLERFCEQRCSYHARLEITYEIQP